MKKLWIIIAFALLGCIALSAKSSVIGTTVEQRKLIARGLYGRIQRTDVNPHYRVRVVEGGMPDLRVRVVSATMANAPGRWQFVDVNPDYRVSFVQGGEDLTISFVSGGEGPTRR